MFDITKVAGQFDADLFLREAQFHQLVSSPGSILFVPFGNSHLLMEESITTQTDAHPHRPNLEVPVDLRMEITSQDHDGQVTDAPKEHLILMDDQDVIHEAEIMRNALIHEHPEPTCQEQGSPVQQDPFIRRPGTDAPFSDI